MEPKVYLITGGNRGIGRAMVSQLLSREATTVIATVRSLSENVVTALNGIHKAQDSHLHIVKLDSSVGTDAVTAASEVEKTLDINHIDVLIANAGISKHYGLAKVTPAEEMEEHFRINAMGPLLLFQAFLPLLERSKSPKFVAISTVLGSITDMGDLQLPFTAYGTSKAALNYIVRKIHFENEKLIAFVISPGWVQTEMGNAGARNAGMKEAPGSLENTVDKILTKIDRSTRDDTSGTFQSFDDAQPNW